MDDLEKLWGTSSALHQDLCIHWWIQTGVTVRKRLIWIKIGNILSRVTLKFHRWTRKTIGHLFYATLTFVHHLKAIVEFKLKLQTTVQKRSIRVKISDFVQCDLGIWWMTLKNNRAPLLWYIKLCASFHSHRWIQTKVTVRKRSIRFKIGDLLSPMTLKFDGWPWKQ